MLFVAITLLVSSACLALGWAQLSRLNKYPAPNLSELTLLLKKTDQSNRIEELLKYSGADSWEHRLGAELKNAPGESYKIAVINDALADVDHLLRERSGWPKASVRLCAFGTMLCGVGAMLVRPDILVLLMVLGVGAGGALLCLMTSQKAERKAARARENIDAFILALMGMRAPGAASAERKAPKRRAAR